MANKLQDRLRISGAHLDEINALLLDPESQVVQDVLDVVAKYGTPDEINRQAAEARKLDSLMGRLRERGSPYVADLEWLIEQRDAGRVYLGGGLPARGAGRARGRDGV